MLALRSGRWRRRRRGRRVGRRRIPSLHGRDGRRGASCAPPGTPRRTRRRSRPRWTTWVAAAGHAIASVRRTAATVTAGLRDRRRTLHRRERLADDGRWVSKNSNTKVGFDRWASPSPSALGAALPAPPSSGSSRSSSRSSWPRAAPRGTASPAPGRAAARSGLDGDAEHRPFIQADDERVARCSSTADVLRRCGGYNGGDPRAAWASESAVRGRPGGGHDPRRRAHRDV